MATHSSILAWNIPWTEAPGRPQSMGLKKRPTGLSDWTTREPNKHIFHIFNIQLKKISRYRKKKKKERKKENAFFVVT